MLGVGRWPAGTGRGEVDLDVVGGWGGCLDLRGGAGFGAGVDGRSGGRDFSRHCKVSGNWGVIDTIDCLTRRIPSIKYQRNNHTMMCLNRREIMDPL